MFLLVAGVEALLMRVQLFYPNNTFLSPYTFNRLFTMHGTTMVFFVGMPLCGLANYLVPLMIGARDMAFPRLNAFGFWISAVRRIFALLQLHGRSGLYGCGFRAGCGLVRVCAVDRRCVFARRSTDYWILGILVSGIGSIASAIKFWQRCSACAARG